MRQQEEDMHREEKNKEKKRGQKVQSQLKKDEEQARLARIKDISDKESHKVRCYPESTLLLS